MPRLLCGTGRWASLRTRCWRRAPLRWPRRWPRLTRPPSLAAATAQRTGTAAGLGDRYHLHQRALRWSIWRGLCCRGSPASGIKNKKTLGGPVLLQSGAVWLWRERRGAALGRCQNEEPQRLKGARSGLNPPRSPGRAGLRPEPALLGWEDRGADWRRLRAAGQRQAAAGTKSAKPPRAAGACGPEFAHCWGLPRNKGKIDYPRRKRI